MACRHANGRGLWRGLHFTSYEYIMMRDLRSTAIITALTEAKWYERHLPRKILLLHLVNFAMEVIGEANAREIFRLSTTFVMK